MKKLLMIVMAGLLIGALTVPALAWEFTMKGEYEYRLRYLGRTGNNDLFGVSSLQDVNNLGVLVGFAGPQLYNRGAIAAVAADSPGTPPNGASALSIVRGGYSTTESDAFFSDSRLTVYPEIRINSVIRLHGTYTIGGYRNKYFQNAGTNFGFQSVGTPPFERYYMSQTSMNAYDTAAIGSWEQFRATFNVPWGTFSIGVKDFPLGPGALLANNTRSESALLVVPYGPFRLLYGIWLARNRFFESWGTVPDSGMKPSLFQAHVATYDNADFSAGYFVGFRMAHVNAYNMNPGVTWGTTTAKPTTGGLGGRVGGIDDNFFVGLVYAKYFNGRFFANAEYCWTNFNRYRLGVYSPNGAPFQGVIQDAAPMYIEAYHFFAELGTVLGPSKLSLMYALSSGPVKNNARYPVASFAGTPAGTFGPSYKLYATMPINYQALAPYQFLMFETYGGGNNSPWTGFDVAFTSDEKGQMSDAYCFAARLDYAVASNLNVWASYIWAHRLEKAGTFKGNYLSTGGTASTAQRQAWITNNFNGTSGEVNGSINPFVDDGYIGWEGGAGVDWKLLEGLTMSWRYSYWQPGDWFTQAYQAVAVRNNAVVSDGILFGRDAIQAVTGSVMIEF